MSDPSAQNERDHDSIQPGWMVTFADLLSLLLTFFVLLFSMNTVQFENWKAVVATMTEQFNEDRPKLELTPSETKDVLTPSNAAGLNLNYLRVLMQRAIESHASFEGVTVRRDGGKVLISIPADLLFGRKDTELVTGAMRPLQQLAGTLAQIKNKVRVEGHTDSVPVSSGKYRSNWDLSMARARIIAGILTDFGYRQDIAILGYADTSSKTYSDEGNPSQQLAKAERVDIVIVAEGHQEGLYDLF